MRIHDHLVPLRLLAVLACTALLIPQPGWADDATVLAARAGVDVITTRPQEKDGAAASPRSARAAVSPAGKWVVFLRSDVPDLGTHQISDYFINKTPNSDGSFTVKVRTTLSVDWGTGKWTTKKTLYDNKKKVASIPADWNSIAKPGKPISQQATFKVKGAGRHHITSTEEDFRTGTITSSGWSFYLEIPCVVRFYDGYSDKPLKTQRVNKGSSATAPAVPKREGHTFAGWDKAFTNVQGDLVVKATWKKKTYKVTFRDHDGSILKTQTVDHGGSATAPEKPLREGYAFTGWDRSFKNVTASLEVRALYEAIISVRVPTLVACTVLADGTVIEPSGYQIENLSKVPVQTSDVTVANQAPSTGITILHGSREVFATDGDGEGLSIPAEDATALTWEVDDMDAASNRALLDKAIRGPAHLCDVRFTFEAAP